MRKWRSNRSDRKIDRSLPRDGGELPIRAIIRPKSVHSGAAGAGASIEVGSATTDEFTAAQDRKSTRLNSSHLVISYAVFCLKKKTEPRRSRPSRRSA